ncbi:dTMP kinase [Longispora sp. NPDC051575]|uniref:dTMP kinase n=1 Tax=Longispora sp. NPDC051575 TaxID=3154943 RepID=UPI003448214A
MIYNDAPQLGRRWRGFFLTLDGPGGVGKSTVTLNLCAQLVAIGVPTYATTEPSHGSIGELARHGTHEFGGRALACLVAADRHHHLKTEIRPALDDGRLVVCDRYLASSLVLQRLDEVPVEYVEAINEGADRPDLSVILTADPDTIRARLTGRGESHGRFEEADQVERELAYYVDAAARLTARGVDVITLNVEGHKPDETAALIGAAMAERWASVMTSTTEHHQGKHE